MSTYPQKKKHIYDYRRRRRAQNYIKKLEPMVKEMSLKDLNRLKELLDHLYRELLRELGWFDEVDSRYEARGDALDRRIKMGESHLISPVAYYVCRKCRRRGYLFSPNLAERKHELYMFHILWPERKAEFCYQGKTKINQLLVLTPPSEGIFDFYLDARKRK